MSFRIPQCNFNEFSTGCMSLLPPEKIRIDKWQCPYFFTPLVVHSCSANLPSQESLQKLWNGVQQVTLMIASVSKQGISIERSMSFQKGPVSKKETTKHAKKEAKALQKRIEKIFKRENSIVFICDRNMVQASRFWSDLIGFVRLYFASERELVDRKPVTSTEVPEDDEKESLFSKCQRIWKSQT